MRLTPIPGISVRTSSSSENAKSLPLFLLNAEQDIFMHIAIIVRPMPMNWNCFNGAWYGSPPAMLLRSESEEIITSPHPLRIRGITISIMTETLVS